MELTQHGGRCCGIWHVHGFDYASVDDLDDVIRRHFSGANQNRILEAILSDRQVVTPPTPGDRHFHPSVREDGGWPVILADRGFVLAEQWVNSNSSRGCYRFIKLNGVPNDTMGSLRNQPLPFPWDGEARLTLRQPARVETVTLPARPIAVGDTVRHREHGWIGEVLDVTTSASVRFEGRRTARYQLSSLERVILATNDGSQPLPVNMELPLAIRNLTTGEIIPATRTGNRSARANRPSRTHGNNNLANAFSYDLDTGDWSSQVHRQIARLFNPTATTPLGVVVIREPAPAPEPVARTVTHTEYFAVFQNGSRRGPFATMEALREAYPRVLSFTTRRVFSDGTLEESEVRRIR